MKILMLNYEFPPLGGGAANANYYLLKEFADFNDMEIDFITSSPNSYIKETFSDNIQIYKLGINKKHIHYWSQLEILRYSRKSRQKARELMRLKQYDLVHAWFGIPCGHTARKLGLPYVVSLRGSDVPGFNIRFSSQYIFLKPLIKNVWKKATKVVANSQGLKKLAQQTLDIPIEVIYNGINTEEFTPNYNHEGILKALCVSRLIKRKGIEYLIEAIRNLEVDLTIVGKGTEEAHLKGLCRRWDIQNKVHFEGYVSHEEIKTYYASAHVFVLPSLNEGMSNTVLEGMASGLPIITTETGGTKELLKENGFVVPVRDAKAIGISIGKYLADRNLIQKHGQISREIAEVMSWGKVADGYYKIYNEAVSNGG